MKRTMKNNHKMLWENVPEKVNLRLKVKKGLFEEVSLKLRTED